MPNSDIIRKFDTKSNLLAPGGLAKGQWGYATDTEELIMRKPDGTYAVIATLAMIWERIGTVLSPETDDDDIKIDFGKHLTLRDTADNHDSTISALAVGDGENKLSIICSDTEAENGIYYGDVYKNSGNWAKSGSNYAGCITAAQTLNSEGFDIKVSDISGAGTITWKTLYELHRNRFRFRDTSGNTILDIQEISGETRFRHGGDADSNCLTAVLPLSNSVLALGTIDNLPASGVEYTIKINTKSQSDFSAITEEDSYILVGGPPPP